MRFSNLKECLEECERFRKRAMELKRLYEQFLKETENKTFYREHVFYNESRPEKAAVVRASLDLWRALAKLRREL